MAHNGYGFFCPVAKASELLEPRWTMLILTEMANGSTRFNDIRRGVPGISPTLLAKRLREMEGLGLLERIDDPASNILDYIQTDAAKALNPIVWQLGQWAWKHVEAEVSLQTLNAQALLWNIRRNIALDSVTNKRTVIQFYFPDAQRRDRFFWLVWRPGVDVEVCMDDPGFDISLYVEAELKAFTAYWMNWTTLSQELANERIILTGDQYLVRTIDRWLVRSTFGREENDTGEGLRETADKEAVLA